MKASGFTIIRNGSRFDYPYIESLRSLLPLVDELVINVGRGDDDTLKRIQDFSKSDGQGKVVIFETDWPLNDPEKKRGGRILSEQTNLALDRCSNDWCIYLQADEVFHEEDAQMLRKALDSASRDLQVEGLLFDYVHFYGSFDIIQVTRSAYRREVRAVRRSSGARSVGDAQSFRKPDGSKLSVIRCGARVFHYGWVRTPEAMKEKTFFLDQLYHGDPSQKQIQEGTPFTGENYKYKRFWGLRRFPGTHPAVMKERIAHKGWNWDFEGSPFIWKWSDSKKVILDLIERFTGVRLFEYKSYQILRRANHD